jgi:formate hydrogenlyase subunit 6/NADH:ubiquinone oxidoreductase subunit I
MSVLSEMLKNLVSKPFTILYPVEKVPVPDTFRGRVVISDDRCIGCGKCSIVCPAQAITMVANPREVAFKEKVLQRKKSPQVKVFSCIRCGLCERHCPTGAISLDPVLSPTGTDSDAVVT